MKTGIIKKVTGPLVVATGMPTVKMAEIVRVSEEKLIGEVVKIEGDEVFIQVYEETSGIGPGEPVYLTGQPLTVELGPGLLGGIFDGVQRPLDILAEKTGAFISRGTEARALNPNKKWQFVPKKKPQDTVQAGDIIGMVQETPLIEHKILVPPYIQRAKIISIKGKGEYTVDEGIAEVITDKQEKKTLTMSHKWLVRDPRPVKEKLIPKEVLVTGQRVIDTFFPIAKGGAGCVPGPFGSGKCVSGDARVMMGNGRIVKMKEIFEEGRLKGKEIKGTRSEEIYNVKGLGNPSVLSFDGLKFKSKEPITVYKGMTDSTVKIRTRTGKKIEVTPIHKLFVMEDGEIKRKAAKDVRKGDYLVSARKIKLNLKDKPISYLKILKEAKVFSADGNINSKAKQYLRTLIKKKELPQIFSKYLRVHRKLPINLLFLISEKININLIPKKVCSYHGETINLPKKVSPELGEFLAYIIADGNLKQGSYSIRFFNASKQLLNRFSELSQQLFGIKPYIEPHPKLPDSFIAQINCKALFEVLVGLGIPFEKKAASTSIPECVLMSSDRTLARFIWTYINCDGEFDSDSNASRLGISSKSKRLIEEFSFAFTRLGIVASICKRRKDGSFRVTVNGSNQLKVLLGYANKMGKIKLLRKSAEREDWALVDSFPVPSYFKEFLRNSKITSTLIREKGIHTERYVYSAQNITTPMFKKVVNAISSLRKVPFRIKQFVKLTEDVFFDKVVEIKAIPQPKQVYDIEVPNFGNFVGGHGALVLSNTVVQHQLCRWSDADVILALAVGERGNEVADLLTELPQLKDPKTGRPLMERTVIIANTSNMPVAAREASIYTGITIAEYFRDMGYSVALLADSTSRWAEALREISGRLEEMPGDEGYPAYLGSRTAGFYERAGYVSCLGSEERNGSLTVIGAVSPPGGDLSEPVTQNTLRVTKVFWSLDAALAYRRHFPAINWLNSYSLYSDDLKEFLEREAGEGFVDIQSQAMAILQKEDELQEIVRLVGKESLSKEDQFLLEIAKLIREDFLHQNAFHDVDTYTSLKKQYLMISAILTFYNTGLKQLKEGLKLQKLLESPIERKISKMKYVPEKDLEKIDDIIRDIGAGS